MPQLGDIKKGKELGYKKLNQKYIWRACAVCGKEQWVTIVKGKPESERCISCAMRGRFGENSQNWKGGRIIVANGYIRIYLEPTDFFFPMANKRHYVLEHRLMVAKALGRCLHRWEIVHHRHDKYPAGSIEDKQDNRVLYPF